MHIIRTDIRYFIVAYFTIQDNFSIGFKNKSTIVDKCLEI